MNIVSESRLESFLDKAVVGLDSTNYEVRAFSKPNSLSTISPLIIGNKHVFLASDDDRLYRASSALFTGGIEERAGLVDR